ncbi:MAG: hypothetical protein HOP10_13080 [Chitinophagaceae bacterium]|nr:hypothetical protein [Chitinophagaceae bacterium]
MNKIIFSIFLVISCIFCQCKSAEDDRPICIYKKSGKTIEQQFPFNQSDRIEIVSYDSRNDTVGNLILDGRFIVNDIYDLVVLNKPQTDSLFSLLYDYERNKNAGPVRYADCYNPRHSVVFYKAGKAIAFWEICLECGGQRQTANTEFDKFCHENTCRIQELFINAGIKDGIIPEQCASTKNNP